MAVLHITEAELVRDIHAVLQQVRGGTEVVVEEDHRPVVVIRPPAHQTRTLSESIALATHREQERGEVITLDPQFSEAVQEVIHARKPWNPPTWD